MSTYFYKALMFISSVYNGISVTPEYCLHPLNKDDCNGRPRKVFSYYRPGSRCDIEIWRGCPTLNMFADEFSCSDMCIGQIHQPPEQAVEEPDDTFDGEHSRFPMFSEIDKHSDGPCYQRFIGDDCGEKVEMKYFFSGDLCVRTEWRGCESPNLFGDLQSCIKLCHPTIYFQPQIEETIAKLPIEEVKLLDKLIEDAIDQETVIRELPILSDKQKRLPQKKINNILLKIYNLKNTSSMEEEISEETMEVVSDREENEDFEDIEESLEEEIEDKEEPKPEPLAEDDEEEEGSLEEVFTLS